VGDVVTAIEALTRYHAAEKRLAEVERDIDAIKAWQAGGRWAPRTTRLSHTSVPTDAPFPDPDAMLQSLYLERERLQAESFRVYMAARRAS
jgi:hypothetical protein